MRPPIVVEIGDESGVGEARRGCAELARSLQLDAETAGLVSLAATEIATNLVKHGMRAQRLVARIIERGAVAGIEILGIDAGPGIANAADALRDGYSTSGTQGTGLGAVRRISHEFDLYSVPDAGSVVLSRIFGAGAPSTDPARSWMIGVVATPFPGEDQSGDSWDAAQSDDRAWLLVADGLGHGPDAALASAAAVRAFRSARGQTPAERLRQLHDELRPTRGAAVAIAEIRTTSRELLYAGIGNIAASIVAPGERRSLITHDGIAGHVAGRIQEFSYPFPAGAQLIMHSDGLTQRWEPDHYPGLFARDPSVIAAVLHRDFSRGRDDATVVVARERMREHPHA